MKVITCNDGARIKVEDETDEATISILRAAPVVRFSEFVYTGNSSRGQNSGNYEDIEAWLKAAGLKIEGDDFTIIRHNMDIETGVHSIDHRGKRLRYHVQGRKGDGNNGFGFVWRVEYRLISVEPVRGGARPGSGRPPVTPGAGLAAALDRAESSITAIEQRGEIRHAEAAALFARANVLSERIERLMSEAD